MYIVKYWNINVAPLRSESKQNDMMRILNLLMSVVVSCTLADMSSSQVLEFISNLVRLQPDLLKLGVTYDFRTLGFKNDLHLMQTLSRARRVPGGRIILSLEWTEQSNTIPLFWKKSLERVLKNIGTISKRTKRELLEKND